MPLEPLAIGVCSWSLQVTSVPELKGFMDKLGVSVVQIACGDPHHASWNEGDNMPEPGHPDRKPFLDTLANVSQLAKEKGITVAFETGQESADLLRRTLDDLK